MLLNWVLVFGFKYLVSVDPMDRSLLHNVKSTVKISSIFVAFSENMNFTRTIFSQSRSEKFWKQNTKLHLKTCSAYSRASHVHAFTLSQSH